jgi:hypothetical protein
MKNLRETYPKPTILLRNQGLRHGTRSRIDQAVSAQAVDFSGGAFFGSFVVVG